MNKRLFTILAGIFAVLSFAACNDDDGIDPSAAEPTITYAYDTLEADLNVVDNLPIVAVVKSEAGLKSVTLSVRTSGGETIPVTTVTDFFNRKSYSLSENINYEADYTEAVIEAVDLLGRKAEAKMPISIVDVVEPPMVVFTPESINYDETVGGTMPNTHFTVSSKAGLQRIEMYRVTRLGQQDYGYPIDFTNGEKDYTFDELINYGEDDRSFKVKATDIYDQVRIVSLPVTYKTVPPPAVTFVQTTITADKNEEKAVEIGIESQAGVVKVELFRVEGKTETSVKTTTYEKLNTLNYAEKMTFTNATSGVKVIVTDNVGRTTTATTKAIVNMVYVESVQVGSHVLTEGNANYPGVYALLSLKDMKTYALSSVLGDSQAEANIDLKVYVFGGQAVLRLYAIDGGTNTKSNEFTWNGKTVMDMTVQNKTRLLKLPATFDFDSATAETISSSITPSNVSSNGINPMVVGDVIAFKTADTSSSGGGRIGIMKLVDNVQAASNNVTSRVLTFSIKFPKE